MPKYIIESEIAGAGGSPANSQQHRRDQIRHRSDNGRVRGIYYHLPANEAGRPKQSAGGSGADSRGKW